MAAVFVLIPVGIIGTIVCGHMRYRRLTVSVEVDGGPTIRRHCTMGGQSPRPEIGQTLRFRHTTLDPENLEDALFDGIRAHQWGAR